MVEASYPCYKILMGFVIIRRISSHKEYDQLKAQPFELRSMEIITKEQYENALGRVEELLPLVEENMSSTDQKVVELSVMSDRIITYEKMYFPIGKPRVQNL